jgi:hypothetical protein
MKVNRGNPGLVLVTFLFAALAAPSFGQAIMQIAGETAGLMAQQMADRAREAGFIMTTVDYRQMEAVFRQQAALQEIRKKAVQQERELRAAGKNTEADAVAKERVTADAALRQIPQPPTQAQIQANYPGYKQQVTKYVKEIAPGMDTRIATMVKTSEATDKAITGIGQSGGAGGVGGGGGANDYQLIVKMVPDPRSAGKEHGVDLYINGVKVAGSGQAIPLARNAPITIRAVGVDARRAFIRDFVESVNASLDGDRTEYRIRYKVSSGGFNGATAFQMKSESYSWNFARLGGEFTQKVSNSNLQLGLQNDLATIQADRPFRLSIAIDMKIEWSMSSQRPGGARSGVEPGTAAVTVEMQYLPR